MLFRGVSAHTEKSFSDLLLLCIAPSCHHCDATDSYLDLGRVEVHVVHPPAAWVDPAGAQTILQRLEGDVQTDHQVQLADPVQRLGLSQCPWETCAGTATARGCQERQESGGDGAKTTHSAALELQNHHDFLL